ncbi:MAG TPA: AAA family ATPase [Polyangiaceae bacterium]|jgi:predicted ATPase/tRNA A-37 threonylcarbamoyl transferase component Bud32
MPTQADLTHVDPGPVLHERITGVGEGERYELRRVLGRGGMGVVHEAYDRKVGTLVALKTILTASAEYLYRLKHEFRALADVQHPNLVRLGELSCEGAQWFFTMELVRGREFVSYVRGARPAEEAESGQRESSPPPARNSAPPPALYGRLDEERLRSAMPQLASAVAAIHDAGHVHRDIKPTNLLVSDDGRLVLLDFGLVKRRGQHERANEDWIVGTPAFMAPEQATGEDVGPAADWYAVGAVLYMALTGVQPFEGTMEAILQKKVERDPVPPHSIARNVPEDLDALCMDLLRREPEARPRFEEIAMRLGFRPRDSASLASLSAADSQPPFVGRGGELRALHEAFEEVAVGVGRAVVVEGEPGIGKSALVQSFLTGVRDRALVLTGRCYEQETVPFKGVDAIVDSVTETLLDRSDESVAALLGATGARYLAALFPVLNRVEVIADAGAGAKPLVATSPAVREHALVELEQLLGAMARETPLVVFLDDLQWADNDSLAFLARVVGRGEARPPWLFVATQRADAAVSPELRALRTSAETIRLHGLSDSEAHELVAALWNTRQGERSNGDAPLVREAEGHPLFLAELVRAARAGSRGAVGKDQLQEILWERIQARDPIEQRFVEMVAIAGAPTPYEVIARASGTEAGEAQTRLGSLRAAQLIRVSRRGRDRLVEPYHDRVRESVAAHLRVRDDEATLAGKRLQLGRELLAATPADQMGERILAIVQNMNAGRARIDTREERLRLATLNLLAHAEAKRATAYGMAAEFARVGLSLVGDEGWTDAYAATRDLHLARIAAESLAGNVEAARQAFDEARAHVTSTPDRTALYVESIELHTNRGAFAEAIQAGRERLRELGLVLPDKITKRRVLAELLAVRLMRGRHPVEDLLHLKKLEGDPIHEGAVSVLVSLVPAGFFVDHNLRTLVTVLAVKFSMRYGVCDVSAFAFAGYGSTMGAWFDKYTEGEALGRVALALNERFENRRFAPRVQFLYGGFHAPWVRPFAEARRALERAFAQARESGDPVYEAYAATVLSNVTFCESSTLRTVAETAAWAREISRTRRDRDMAAVPDIQARYAAALAGQTPDPRDLSLPDASEEALAAGLDAKTPTAFFYYRHCKAELAYLFGDPEEAHRLLKEAATRINVIHALPTLVELCFLQTLVAARLYTSMEPKARAEEDALLDQRLRKLRAWARSCPANFAAHHLIAAGEVARARGALAEAEMNLERAVTAAQVHRSAKREAIALELASDLAAARGEPARADALREEAAAAYERWGARTKAASLVSARESAAIA